MSRKLSLAESLRQAAQVSETPAPTAAMAAPPPMLVVATPKATASFQAATRVGKKKVTAPLTLENHKRLRQLALDRDVTTEALLVEAITDLLAKYGIAATGQGSRPR